MHRLLLALVLPLSGCFVSTTSAPDPSPEPTPSLGPAPEITSASLDVSQMSASLSAQSDGNTITVYGALLHDLNQFVRLDSGDYFTATIADETIVLGLDPNQTAAHYQATFPAQTGDTNVVIAFVRRSGKKDAPTSAVVVPAAFKVTSIPPVAFRPGDGLKISIAPLSPVEGRYVEVAIEGPCLVQDKNIFPVTLTETGEGSIDTSNIVFDTTNQQATGCDVDVHVRRLVQGQIDPAFRSGLTDFEGLQVRTFSTAIIP
jgi:hypothetical protein